MKVIGIDPGYDRLGIAVIERARGSSKERLVFSECFVTSPKLPFLARLRAVGEEIGRVIEETEASSMAIETLFLTNNQKTAMAVAEARGVILYEAARRNVPVREFTPSQIKAAVTGYGKSDKSQVISMIPRLIKIPKDIRYDDEYDAIAAALTALAIPDPDRLASKTAL